MDGAVGGTGRQLQRRCFCYRTRRFELFCHQWRNVPVGSIGCVDGPVGNTPETQGHRRLCCVGPPFQWTRWRIRYGCRSGFFRQHFRYGWRRRRLHRCELLGVGRPHRIQPIELIILARLADCRRADTDYRSWRPCVDDRLSFQYYRTPSLGPAVWVLHRGGFSGCNWHRRQHLHCRHPLLWPRLLSGSFSRRRIRRICGSHIGGKRKSLLVLRICRWRCRGTGEHHACPWLEHRLCNGRFRLGRSWCWK